MHWDAATTRRRVGDERKALATELSTAHSSLERGPDAVAAEFAASYDRLQSLNARMHAPAAQPAGLIVTGIIAFLLAAFIPAGLTQNVAVGALFGAAGAGAAVFLINPVRGGPIGAGQGSTRPADPGASSGAP